MIIVSTFHGAYDIGNNLFILSFPLLSAAVCAHMGNIYLWDGKISPEGLQIEILCPEQQQQEKQQKAQLYILTFTCLDVTPLNV